VIGEINALPDGKPVQLVQGLLVENLHCAKGIVPHEPSLQRKKNIFKVNNSYYKNEEKYI
jgi:hypothetical protein